MTLTFDDSHNLKLEHVKVSFVLGDDNDGPIS